MATQSKLTMTDFKAFAEGSPVLLSAAAFLILVSFVRVLLYRPKKLDFPVIGSLKDINHRKSLVEGAMKYRDSPFIIPTASPLIILPPTMMNEVRNLPENKASFMEDVRRAFLSKYTGIGAAGHEAVHTIKHDLTLNIASTLDDLQDEIRYGFDKELGSCEDWTSFNVYSKVTRVVALLSGRVFVGRPLSREEEWIDASIMFTYHGMQARNALDRYPEWIRGMIAPFTAGNKKLHEIKQRGAELLKPMLDAQLAKSGDEKLRRHDTEDEQGTFISWLLKYTKEAEKRDPMVLANHQMVLTMAAIHTTSGATTSIIFDLAAHPEYIQPLRDEIKQVIDEDGYEIEGDGFKKLKKSSIPKLWKLDSFMKESQRLTPPGLVSGVRMVTSPLTLSTGQILPKGARFAFASDAIQTSDLTPTFSPALNPPVNKPVSEFDGLRFYNLRKIPGNENKFQFATVSPDSMSWGHGNHACPGRFFASNEIKVMLIELLNNWEFRFPEGKGRPDNYVTETTVMPNTMAEMEFKMRKR